MLAAFTPTVTLVLLYLFRVETPTLRASVCVLIIGLGCALSSYGEGHFNLVGVAYRSLGILSEATRLVLTQARAPLFMWPLRPHTHTYTWRYTRTPWPPSTLCLMPFAPPLTITIPLLSLSPRWQHLLKNHKLSVFESQYYLAPVGAGFLLVGAAFSETSKAIQMDALGTIASHPSLFAASAVLGVIASMLTFLVIKLTNSVTLKVRVPHGPSNPQ